MVGKVRDDALDGFTYFCLPASVHNTTHNVYLRHGEPWKGDLLVVIEKRHILQKGFGLERPLRPGRKPKCVDRSFELARGATYPREAAR